MRTSTDRILTTHTGSLPRPDDLTALLEALDAGTVPDPAAFEARVRQAVADIVRAQRDAGVDIVSDGEQGKVGYSTYVRHRLTGFGGRSRPACGRGRTGPTSRKPPRAASGARRSSAPTCNGPIDWKDRDRGRARTSPTSRAARRGGGADRRVHDGGLARRHRALPDERALPDPRGLPGAARRRHERGVRRHPQGGLRAPGRLPGPGHEPPPRLPRAEQRGVPQDRRGQRRGAQPRAARHPARPACACTSAGATTRVRTTATSRCARSCPSRCKARPQAHLVRGRQPAARARVGRVPRTIKLPDDRLHHPRRARLDDQLHRASGAGRPAHRPLRRGRRARARHRRQRLRLRDLRALAVQRRAGDRVGQASPMAEGARLASAQLWGGRR